MLEKINIFAWDWAMCGVCDRAWFDGSVFGKI